MKKIIFYLFIILPSIGISQSLEKEDFVIDIQMGIPNLSYFRSTINGVNHFLDPNSQMIEKHKSIGQFIINSEFFLTDKFGFTIGGNYGYYYDYKEFEETIYDGNTNTSSTVIYFAERILHRYRFYIGPNFHFIRSDRLDTYLGLKGGIKSYKIKTKDNLTPDLKYLGFENSTFEFPVGFRVCYGLRFFPTEHLAINTEFGLGGPLLSFGLTYKVTNN